MERTPPRTARLMPSAPCAWAATSAPESEASSTAARICSSVSSGAPGTPPGAMTAPVAISFTKSAPPCSTRRTARRTSSTESATPTRNSCGTTASTSGARPVMSPPPPEQVTYAPATRMRGPATQPSSMASRNATSTKARNVPTSRTVVKPASRVSRALRAPDSASWAPVRASTSRVPVAAVGFADQVSVTVDHAGQHRLARQVHESRTFGRYVAGCDNIGDPMAIDDDGAVAQQFPGHRIEQQMRADYRGHGNGHPATIGRAPGAGVTVPCLATRPGRTRRPEISARFRI